MDWVKELIKMVKDDRDYKKEILNFINATAQLKRAKATWYSKRIKG